MMQRISISSQRTFQQAASEPLGPDWGRAELHALVGVRSASASAIRQAQSNADPAVAELRRHLASIERIAISLPAGQDRESLLRGVKNLHTEAEGSASRAQLQVTATRAGKQAQRQNGRPENQRVVTALLPNRTHKRSHPSLAQQAGQQRQQQADDWGHEFKPQAKKGKATNKVCMEAAWAAPACWWELVLDGQGRQRPGMPPTVQALECSCLPVL